jgi:hypothetical protein
MQLEDDVLTKKSFIKIMKNFALEKTAAKQNWFVIDFCQLGFIGIFCYFCECVIQCCGSGSFRITKLFAGAGFKTVGSNSNPDPVQMLDLG